MRMNGRNGANISTRGGRAAGPATGNGPLRGLSAGEENRLARSWSPQSCRFILAALPAGELGVLGGREGQGVQGME